METQCAEALAVRQETPARLLVESQGRPDEVGGSNFLRTAWHLAAAGMPPVVFLIDDGVSVAVGFQPDVARAVRAGVSVWADDESLLERAISPDHLVPGVVPAGLDKVTPLLFDPAVKVVWH